MERVGPYAVEERLGAGAMGVVYRARHLELGRRVALKVLSPTAFEDPRMRERFRREAQNAARLQHPNIATVYETGGDDDAVWIAMELIDGEPLSAWRARRRPPAALCARVIEQAARAAHSAHERGVIHRDLKPANILVDARDVPHIVDFGLSRATDSEHGMTRTGAVIGSPAYMAPEQVRGDHRDVDARSDVYALGVVLHELLSGRPPFEGRSTVELFHRILAGDPPRLTGVPADLEAICLRAMDRDRAHRYATAAEFADDLARFVAGEAVVARKPGAARNLARTLSRHRGAAVAAALALALAIAALAGVVARRARARQQRDLVAQADALYLAGDLRGAKERYDRALGAGPHAHAAARSRECAAAFERLERRARELEPKLDRAMEEIERAVRLTFRDWDRARWDAHLSRAAEIVSSVLADDPAFARAHLVRGRMLFERMRFAEAVAAFTRALELHPDHPGVFFERARARLAQSQAMALYWAHDEGRVQAERPAIEKAALDDLRRAGDREPLVPVFAAIADGRAASLNPAEIPWEFRDQAHLHAGYAHLAGRRHAAAIDAFTAAIKERAANPLARAGRALALEAAARRAEALADLDAAIEIQPDWCFALHTRALLRHRAGNTDGALDDFRRAEEADPTFAGVHYGRSLVWLDREMWNDAVAEYTSLIAKAGESETVYRIRGTILMQAGRFDDAVADLTRAAELDPRPGEPLYLRGLAHTFRHDRRAAIADFTAALQREPGLYRAHQLRGVERELDGDTKGAVEDFEAALRLAPPDWEGRADVERRLAAAKPK